MSSWKDQIVANVVAAREPSTPAATMPAPAAPVAHAPAPAPAATDYSELWRKAIAKVSPPSPVAGALGHAPVPVPHAPAPAPAAAALDYGALWEKTKAKAAAPVFAQLNAMGLG